ncbi:MAG: aldehyde dehydrogenase [Rhizobiaceae bacterium]|nr:aldehyde dehydrogenase [Rhizobiaceae bacterium]MCV0405746.1 aldehyde dehydrogenase [Rhizobiaceae bacterium]
MNLVARERETFADARPALSTVADARHAANVAASAFPAWSSAPPSRRRSVLERAAVLLAERGACFARLIAEETGGTQAWSDLNVRLGADILRHLATLPAVSTGEVLPAERPGMLALGVRQPCGVVLSLAPWNAPIVLAVRAIATPLACGNTVVFKASELCPRTHQLVAELFFEAGLPAGALTVVHNDEPDAEEIVEALVAHPAVRRVNFTGSTRVGRVVAQLCARHLKRSLLELGGKAPLIVLDDADLDEAARAAAYGSFFHRGQICMSTERLVVHDSVADDFVERLRLVTERMSAATRDEPARMISEAAAIRAKGLIDDAVSRGARLVCGGRRQEAVLDAAILDDVTSDMRVYHEETFGPIAAVIRYGDVDEAVSIANDTEYGLAGAVFGRDAARALDVARRLETGICHVNGATIHDEPAMPFGGVKASGWGRFGGRAGLEEFTELRWISVQSGPGDYPL